MINAIDLEWEAKSREIRFEPGIPLVYHADESGHVTASPAEVACLLKSYTRDGQKRHRAASLDLRTGEIFNIDPPIEPDEAGVVLRTVVPMVQSHVGEWRDLALPEHLQEIGCIPNPDAEGRYSISESFCEGLTSAASIIGRKGGRLMTATGERRPERSFDVQVSAAGREAVVRAKGRSPMDARRQAMARLRENEARLETALSGARTMNEVSARLPRFAAIRAASVRRGAARP